MKNFFVHKLKPLHVGLLCALTLLLLGVMDFYSLPRIAKAAGGIQAFDLQTFGYSYATAQQFLKALNESGKNLFLRFQLPLDFAFAVVYTLLFLALFYRLHPLGSKLFFLPLLLFAADIVENSLSIAMLSAEKLGKELCAIASAVTLTKNVLTAVCAVLILVFLVLWFKNRRKK